MKSSLRENHYDLKIPQAYGASLIWSQKFKSLHRLLVSLVGKVSVYRARGSGSIPDRKNT